MSDDNDDSQGDGETSPKKKGDDLAALNEQLKAQGYDPGSSGTALKQAMEDMQRRIKPLRALQEQMKSLEGLNLKEHAGIAARLAAETKRYSAVQSAMGRALEPYRDLQDRMKTLGLTAGEGSSISRLAKQIADQQRSIEAVRRAIPNGSVARPDPALFPRPDQIKLPSDPIFETNERLGRIEDRFEQMQDIATDAAQIANGLQGAAAEFLQKFEKAAAANNRTAGRAIWIGVGAVFIAIAMPLFQILYHEFRRTPDNGPEIQATLEQIQAGLTTLRYAQADAAAQL